MNSFGNLGEQSDNPYASGAFNQGGGSAVNFNPYAAAQQQVQPPGAAPTPQQVQAPQQGNMQQQSFGQMPQTPGAMGMQQQTGMQMQQQPGMQMQQPGGGNMQIQQPGGNMQMQQPGGSIQMQQPGMQPMGGNMMPMQGGGAPMQPPQQGMQMQQQPGTNFQSPNNGMPMQPQGGNFMPHQHPMGGNNMPPQQPGIPMQQPGQPQGAMQMQQQQQPNPQMMQQQMQQQPGAMQMQQQQPVAGMQQGITTGNAAASSSRGPIQRIGAADTGNRPKGYMPIRDLSCYAGGFKIFARVISKSEMRKFTNQRGEGQLFNVELMDEHLSEISGTFFGNEAQKFFQILQEGSCYIFHKGEVKNANKRYRPNAEFEITFNKSTQITPVPEADCGAIPDGNWNFVKISTVETTEKGKKVDICAIVHEIGDTAMVNTKNGESAKVEFQLVDQSGCSIGLTVWGQKGEKLKASTPQVGVVWYVKGAQVGDFQGRTLSGGQVTEPLPSDQRVQEILTWYNNNPQLVNQARRLGGQRSNGAKGRGSQTIREILAEQHKLLDPQPTADGGEPPRVLWHNLECVEIASIAHSKEPYYLACPEKVERPVYGDPTKTKISECRKKLDKVGFGDNPDYWVCADGHKTLNPDPRYIIRMHLTDESGSTVATAFDDIGGTLLADRQNILQAWQPLVDQHGNQQVNQFGQAMYHDEETGVPLTAGEMQEKPLPARTLWKKWQSKETNAQDGQQIENLFNDKFFTRWKMVLMCEKETYNDDTRCKYKIFKAEQLLGDKEKARKEEILTTSAEAKAFPYDKRLNEIMGRVTGLLTVTQQMQQMQMGGAVAT
ncbi:unnamed protein product [Amoebophrya sp. A120]|nr:unnamed protein product [Amoebophrya sp. A120]|eukprot:GSA120T00003066001.1